MVDANDGLAKSSDLVNTTGDSVIKVRPRAKRSPKSRGRPVAIQDFGSGTDVFCIPTGKLYSSVDGTNKPACALDVVTTRVSTGGTKGVESSVHAAKSRIEQMRPHESLAVIDVPLVTST